MLLSSDRRHLRRMELRRQRNAEGLCAYCGLSPKVANRIGCEDCGRGHSKENTAFSKQRRDRTALYRKRTRKKAIDKYGGVCSCCGEQELLFLTIDHSNGDGHKDRLKYGGTAWYMELLRVPNRSDLQVQCYNCNMGREINGGICPHKSPTPNDLWAIDLRRVHRWNAGCKYKWPSDEALLSLYRKIGCNKAARTLEVSPDALIKRLNRRGLRKKKDEVAD